MGQMPTEMSEVGATHQNAVADSSIGTTVCSFYWPKTLDSMLWSFALEYAVDLWNHLPDMDTGLSLLEDSVEQ
eukprot:15228701-Ditylum_brightwellii.AAC.1